MTEFKLFQALRPLYPAREYALLPQVANGTGSNANRHADALALSLWPSRGLHLHGFEMKSYRGDWLRELRDPAKAEEIAGYCHCWWIVTTDQSVTKTEELPEPWGLMTWDLASGSLKKIKAAPLREPSKRMDTSFLAAILRNAQDVNPTTEAINESYAKGLAAGRLEAEQKSRYEPARYEELQNKVREFEKASGVSLEHPWNHPRDIGQAVKLALNDSLIHEQDRLRQCALHILQELGGEAPKPKTRRRA